MRRAGVAVALFLLAGCSGSSADGVVSTVKATVTVTAVTTTASRTPSATSTRPSASATTTASRSVRPSTSRSTSSPPAPTDCVGRTLQSLTDAQRVGQLLMVGVPVSDPASALGSIGDLPIGGIFLADRSSTSPSTIKDHVQEVQSALHTISGAPLLVAVDQEGGQVQTLQPPGFSTIPSAVEQGQEDHSELAEATAGWAGELVEAGVNLDLAPVADVVPDGESNPPIGAFDRQFGSQPEEVADSVVTVVTAMQQQGLGATVKHFPGLGRVPANTDTSTDAVDDRTTADDEFLQPFRDAIAAHTTAVMVSSARYPLIDPDHIAAFSSKIITGILRDSLNFQGLVISDDLGGAVAVEAFSPGQRAVDFVAAGGDMVLTVQIADLPKMTAALLAAEKDPAFKARVDNAATHVLRSKSTLGVLTCPS